MTATVKPKYKWHGINIMLLCVSLFTAVQYTIDQVALFYGTAVGLVNLSMSYGLYWWHRQRIAKYQAQALVLVVRSMVFRWFAVCGLLVFGLRQMDDAPTVVLVGFVIGQLFYLINQLIRVATQHGK